MRISHLTLKNWRNFRLVDIDIHDRLFIVGPNASGKSNLLDALRFLRDIAKVGGGFQQAVVSRGGMSRIRCLSARSFNHGRVAIAVNLVDDGSAVDWTYELDFSSEPRGQHRPVVRRERVLRDGELIVERPDRYDVSDSERLTQTSLEQVNTNKDFRDVAEFLSSVRYLHIVPQVVRDVDRAGDQPDDPFGGDFLPRVARTPQATRERRLKTLNQALKVAVPQLEDLELTKDVDGKPHLEARYRHWRAAGARQDERDFSDGTLRLIGLLWALLESGRAAGPLLLEEPELSLHSAVVEQLPSIFARVRQRGGPQVLLSTHADNILQDPGLAPEEAVILTPGPEGTTAQLASEKPDVIDVLHTGMSLKEIVRPLTTPSDVAQLALSIN